MPGHDFARELLAAAESDMKALAHMLDPNGFDDRIFGFHAQQADEKADQSARPRATCVAAGPVEIRQLV